MFFRGAAGEASQYRTKIEPIKRSIIEIRQIFVRGLRAAFPPRVCRSLNRESVPYINSCLKQKYLILYNRSFGMFETKMPPSAKGQLPRDRFMNSSILNSFSVRDALF